MEDTRRARPGWNITAKHRVLVIVPESFFSSAK
jgi:hypothetical protein